MAQFIYTGELKLDRNHVLKSTIKRRLETHYIQPSESERINVRHYPHASFYESGHLDNMAKKMGEQIFNSLPNYKRPSGVLLEQSFSSDIRLLLIKQPDGYSFEIRRLEKK